MVEALEADLATAVEVIEEVIEVVEEVAKVDYQFNLLIY